MTWALIVLAVGWAGWLATQIVHVVVRSRQKRGGRLEVCETCGKELRPSEVWELREYPDDDAALGNPTGHGGTYMSAIYCRKHFPADRERWTA